MAELRQQLQKLGGSGSASEVKNDNSIFPSIRKLPLLGVTYFDLYRESKIQETLYQLLTQQYELAKVEEAKEIPSVKVFDAAIVPTKKSYPPRTLIVVSGTLLILAATVVWIFLRKWWSGIARDDPGRELAVEMGESFRASVRHLAPLGTAALVKRLLGKRPFAPETPPDGEGNKKDEGETITEVPI